MSNIDSKTLIEDDKIIIKVTSSQNLKKLGYALVHIVDKYRYKNEILIRAIGAPAQCQALKAVAFANGIAGPKGYQINLVPFFSSLQIDEKTISILPLRVKVVNT